ncbi:MAG TPA: MGMT family protein [Candidatus Ornithoclostridium faecigallinarum]|nr:MGMT family protein [Candidatus Ornithoclostridium faecigallinarum]
MSFFENVYEAVQLIPRGKVATYGQIARMIGAPRSSRAVGYALHANPRPGVIPCHRVVNREGRLAPAFAFGGPEIQAQLLESEGVEVGEDFVVDLGKYLWQTSEQVR